MKTFIKPLTILFLLLFSLQSPLTIPDTNTRNGHTITESKKSTLSKRTKKNLLIAISIPVGFACIYGSTHLAAKYLGFKPLYNFFQSEFFRRENLDKKDAYKESDLVLFKDRGTLILPTDRSEHIEIAQYHPKQAEGGTVAIVYFGGSDQDNIIYNPALNYVAESTGCPVFTVNYPGFGGSQGDKSFDGSKLAAQTLVSHLKHRYTTIIPIGFSYGGTIATYIAQQNESPLLLLNSTFTSVEDIGRERCPTKYKPIFHLTVPSGELDSAGILRKTRHAMNVIIAHGSHDEEAGFEHAVRLAELAESNPTIPHTDLFMLKNAHHNDSIKPSVHPDHWEHFVQQVRAINNY